MVSVKIWHVTTIIMRVNTLKRHPRVCVSYKQFVLCLFVAVSSARVMGARRNFCRWGKTTNTKKCWQFFGAPKRKSIFFSVLPRLVQTNIFAFFFFLLRRFRLNLRVFIASDNFRVFRRRAVYDVIFFKFQEASAPSLQAPMARVPHKLQYSQFIVHQVNTCFNGLLLHNKWRVLYSFCNKCGIFRILKWPE